MEEVDENINGAIETTGTDRDAGIPKALDDMKHMNGQCVTGKTFDHREITTKDDNGTTSIQNGQCDLGEDCENSQLVEKVQTKTDPDSISSQNEYGNENSDIVKNGSDSTETDIVGNNIRPVIPMAKVMAKARNSLKDLAAKVLSSPDRRPDSETSITNENEKEEDHNEVLNDTNATETDSKEKKPDIRNENIEADIGPDSGGDLEMTDLDKENRLEDDLLNPNLEEGTHMEIASDSEDFLLQLSPDQDTENCKIKEEAPAEVQIKSKSDNNYKKSSPDHVEHTDVLNDDSNVAHLKESVQSVKTSGVLDKYNEGCVLNKTNICKNESIKLEKDDTHNSKSALEEVGDNKKPLEENDKKDSMCNEMPVKVVEIDITPEKSPQKKDSKKDDEDDDDDDVIFEGESKVDLTIRYKEPDPKDHPVNDDSIDQSKTETVKLEPKQTPETSVTPTSAHVIEDDDDVIFEKETKIDLSVQNICKENKNQHKSKESGCDWKTGVAKRTESSEAVIHEDEPNSKPICDKKETVTVGTSLQKGTDNKSSNIERKRAAEEPQLTSSDSKRSKLELVCTSKEVVSPVEEPASIDLIDSDEEMDTTDHTPTSVPQNDEGSSEEKEETKMITISAEELEALVRKKVKEYLAVQRDALLAQMSQKLQDFQSNNDLWKRQVKDLQVKVNDVTVLQQKHEKRKAHTAALRQITTRNVAVQVDDGRTGGTKIKPQVGTTNPSSPLLTIPKALPPAAGRIVTSPPGGTGTIRLPIPQSSIAPPIMTPMITQQPVTTDFKTPTVKSLLGTTRTQPTISCVAVTSPTSSGPIISMQHQRVVTASTSATTYISLPPGAVTSTSTKIITNSNRTTKIIDLTDDEPRMLVTLPQAVAPVGGTGVRTVLSQASQIVHAGFPNTSGTIQLVLASGSQPLKPGTIITGLPQNLIQSLPATPASAVNVTSPPGSSQPLVVTTVITHPRPAAPTLLQTSGLGTGLATAQVTGLASVPVTSLASAPVTSLASAPVTSLASVPVKGQALVPVMGIASAPVTSVAAVPVTGLASAQATSKAPAPTSAPSSTTTIVRASPLAPAKIMPNKHPAPFPLMNTLQKAESKCIPPKPSLRVSRVNQESMSAHTFGITSHEGPTLKPVANVSKGTLRRDLEAVKLLRLHLSKKNELSYFEDFSEEKLAEVLCHFYMEVRKMRTGELFSERTLGNVRRSLNRYLKSPPHMKNFDIIVSESFECANNCFKAAIDTIREAGKGLEYIRKILRTDLRKLYNSDLFSLDTPRGLLNQVQMNVRLYFCKRANENFVCMTKDTFVIALYNESKYLVKKEDLLSLDGLNKRKFSSGQMPEDKSNPRFCPIATFTSYLSKLNPDCCYLWQCPRTSYKADDTVWYENCPLNDDALSNFMPSLSEEVHLSKVYSNECIRVTGESLGIDFFPAQLMDYIVFLRPWLYSSLGLE